MYQTPKLERFGTLRQMTLGGGKNKIIDPYGPTSNGLANCQDVPGGSLCLNS